MGQIPPGLQESVHLRQSPPDNYQRNGSRKRSFLDESPLDSGAPAASTGGKLVPMLGPPRPFQCTRNLLLTLSQRFEFRLNCPLGRLASLAPSQVSEAMGSHPSHFLRKGGVEGPQSRPAKTSKLHWFNARKGLLLLARRPQGRELGPICREKLGVLCEAGWIILTSSCPASVTSQCPGGQQQKHASDKHSSCG